MSTGFAQAHPLPPEPLDRPAKLLLLVALALLVPIMARALPWLYEQGKLPIKPRDYTLLLLMALFGLLAIGRPKLCLPSFILLAPPLMRVLDAAFLRRFDVNFLGEHSVFVMNLLSACLVSLAAIALLASPHWRKIAYWLAASTLLFVNLSIYYEAAGFAEYTRIPGRLSGFPVDPNDGPITTCLMLGICLTLQPAFWKNLALAAFATPAVALTMSRSGMAIFAFMVMLYVLLNARRHFTGLVLIAALSFPLVLGGVAMLAQRTGGGLIKDENTKARLQAIYELDFEKLKSPERAKDLADGWEAVGQKPLWGHGTGAGTAWWQPHNQFVAVWLDIGLPGLLFFAGPLLLLTLLSALNRMQGLFCLIPVWLFIPCSQVLLDAQQFWFCLGVAACVLIPGRFSVRLGGLREALTRPLPSPQASARL
jgi:O-antigen ligase